MSIAQLRNPNIRRLPLRKLFARYVCATAQTWITMALFAAVLSPVIILSGFLPIPWPLLVMAALTGLSPAVFRWYRREFIIESERTPLAAKSGNHLHGSVSRLNTQKLVPKRAANKLSSRRFAHALSSELREV